MNQTTKTQITNGAKLFVDFLLNEGVEKIFGYPGAAVLPIYDELGKLNKIKHYLCRHEQAAVHAADGYARVTKKAGVVLATSGPGASNTITGILNAYADKSPLVVIVGQCEELGHNNFQESDLSSIAQSCTKNTYLITKEKDIIPMLSDAFRTAQKAPMGPVVVSVVKSILTKTFEHDAIEKKYIPQFNVAAKQSHILQAIDLLKNANRPAILVGGGCYDTSSLVREFINISNFPVINTLMGKGVVEDYSLGMIGINGSNLANSIIEESDVLLVLGSRLDTRITGNFEKYL